MAEQRIPSFQEFWPYYVGEHRDPRCRTLHYIGTCAGTMTAFAAVATGTWWLLAVGLVLGYGPAWVGHFFVEHNRPATFEYPLWSLMSDYKMLSLALRGKMGDEVTRLYGSPAPSRDAPLRHRT
jgi:hypothetical protein